MRTLKRIITAPFVLIAAVILLLEDWLWDDLQRVAAWIGHLPIFRQVESLILKLPPWGALAIFLLPSLILIPVKLLALYFISRGHALIGVGTIVAAKIAGTALVARLFTLTKPKLLTFHWFSTIYQRIVAFKARVYVVIKSSAIYTWMHIHMAHLRESFRVWRGEKKSWLKRRWYAVMRHSRRRR